MDEMMMNDNVTMESTTDDYLESAGDIPAEVETKPGRGYAKGLIGGGIAVVATVIGVAIWRKVTGRKKYVERPAAPIGDVVVGRRPGNNKK